MSPLVILPSRPVPATDDSGKPDSSEMRLADGMAKDSDFCASAFGAAGAAGLGASAFGAAGLAGAAPA
jgi:hypothetical protein